VSYIAWCCLIAGSWPSASVSAGRALATETVLFSIKPAFTEAAREVARAVLDAVRAVILAAVFAAAHDLTPKEVNAGTSNVARGRRRPEYRLAEFCD
jgi:hypothetical protein